MATAHPLVVGIVGVDGCGKTSAYRGLLERLAARMPVSGIGEDMLSGGPGVPLVAPAGTRLSRATTRVGMLARRTQVARSYQLLKLLELAGRSRLRDAAVAEGSALVVVTDGDPLVNSAAWSAAGYYARELAGDDDRLLELIAHLGGDARLSVTDLARLPRRSWQLAIAERLGLVHFEVPDLILLLVIDGDSAMARIRARGRPLQAHESEAFLDRLSSGYERVCDLLARRRQVPVVRIDVTRRPASDVVLIAETAVLEALAARATMESEAVDAIDVIATTMSGSLQDQRNVGRIGPQFRLRTRRLVRVHAASSHAEARSLAHEAVAGGSRTLVSAGGAGTFNAVLEGCHLDQGVPADLRLAFLRKGSADLIGKALHVPGDLEGAVDAIVAGIEGDMTVTADILVVEGVAPDGSLQRRHIVGFAGLELFGDVPRFTESRMVKLYKGVLGTLFGDYGPFFVGLTLATLWWFAKRLRGRVSPLMLAFDDETADATTWLAIIVVNGDLGRDFPLGRGLAFGSGTFRVVALRYQGLRRAIAQLQACRSGAVLDDPLSYGAIVRETRSLAARPAPAAGWASRPGRPIMVNVDGLKMPARGEVRFSVSGAVRLVLGQEDRP